MSPTAFYQMTLFDQATGPAKPRQFAVQLHDATSLHYDFRLEHAGVFKSWAMPKGPCLDALVRRLAVQVKDHEIGYYEGTMPAGVYGAGTVLLWDRGFWFPDQDVNLALRAGKLRFHLLGKKLKGMWSLTRMRSRSGEKNVNWILRKEIDEEARSLSETDILIERPESVHSGRTLEEVAFDPPPFRPSKPGAKRGRKPARNQLSLLPDELEE